MMMGQRRYECLQSKTFTRPDKSLESSGCTGKSRVVPLLLWPMYLFSFLSTDLLLQIFMHLRHYTRPVFQVRHTHNLLDAQTGIR